eukprot:1166148-Prorocentrum_lima.AAC.1
MVEYFDQEMHDGNSPNALVVDGCSLYNRLKHPFSDPFHFLLDPQNVELVDAYILEAVQLLQMLFWNNKALVASNEFRKDCEVAEITLAR